MTDKLPRVRAATAIKVLERVGFVLVRQSGSHRIYKNEEGRRTTVPFHSNKILHPKILKNILRDADITIEQFNKLKK